MKMTAATFDLGFHGKRDFLRWTFKLELDLVLNWWLLLLLLLLLCLGIFKLLELTCLHQTPELILQNTSCECGGDVT